VYLENIRPSSRQVLAYDGPGTNALLTPRKALADQQRGERESLEAVGVADCIGLAPTYAFFVVIVN